MRLINIVRLSVENVFFRKGRFLALMLLTGMSLFAVGYYRVFLAGFTWDEDVCDRLLTKGIAGTGLVRAESYSSDEFGEYMASAVKSGMIDSIGAVDKGGNDITYHELREKQRKMKGMDPEDDYFWFYFIDYTALGLCKLSFQAKREVSKEEWQSEDWTGIYLGAGFADVPIGTTYAYERSDGTVWRCEVVGILKRGQEMIYPLVLSKGYGNGFLSTECLDNMALLVGRSFCGELGYVPAEGVSLEQAREYLKALADDMGIRVEFASLEEGFMVERMETETFVLLFWQLNGILVSICVIINVSIVIMDYMLGRSDYGICYAMGFSKLDIVLMFLFENLIKMITAFLLAWGVLRIFCMKTIISASSWSISSLINRYAFPWMICMAVILAGVFALCPILAFGRKRPVKLLNEFRG